jgi:hypothetical protein
MCKIRRSRQVIVVCLEDTTISLYFKVVKVNKSIKRERTFNLILFRRHLFLSWSRERIITDRYPSVVNFSARVVKVSARYHSDETYSKPRLKTLNSELSFPGSPFLELPRYWFEWENLISGQLANPIPNMPCSLNSFDIEESSLRSCDLYIPS